MPQIWTSDDTDAYERQLIQAGTSYGYPPSVMGCHVSASPNHQTARTSPIESRFNVAAFGVLGYELDLGRLTPAEQKAVAALIIRRIAACSSTAVFCGCARRSEKTNASG